jgi:fumarate reductase subunit C
MNQHHRHAAQPYVRPMQGWWRRDPFFVRYMGREATSLAVLAYAVILAVGLVRLAQGEAAWNGWMQALRSPWSILLHLVLLAAMAIHAHSWFEIMPKTMPMLYVGGERVSAPAIRRTGWIATVAVTLSVLALAAWWPR